MTPVTRQGGTEGTSGGAQGTSGGTEGTGAALGGEEELGALRSSDSTEMTFSSELIPQRRDSITSAVLGDSSVTVPIATTAASPGPSGGLGGGRGSMRAGEGSELAARGRE